MVGMTNTLSKVPTFAVGTFGIISDEIPPSQDHVRRQAHLGTGMGRTVYALDSQHVLKMAGGFGSYEFGKIANLSERDFWERLDDSEDRDDRSYFARTIACASDGAWLVMERVQRTPTEKEYIAGCKDKESALNELFTVGEDNGVDDWGNENIGVTYGGRLVIIDYAHGAYSNGLDETIFNNETEF